MHRFLRQIIYFLMLTLASNAFGWTFNKEAVADVWFSEQYSSAADDGNYSGGDEEIKAVSSEKPCDHWCHSVGHFVGFLSQHIIVMPKFADNYAIQQSPPSQSLSLDGLFRPPRLLS